MTDTDPGGPLIAALQLNLPVLLGGLITSLVLSLLYALVTAVEAALPAIPGDRLEDLAGEDDSAAQAILRLKENPHLSGHRIRTAKLTLLVLLGFVFGGSSLSYLRTLMPETDGRLLLLIALLPMLLVCFLLQAFCDELPSRLARRSPEEILRRYRHFYRVLEFFFAPLAESTRIVGHRILRKHGIDPENEDLQLSEEVLRELLDRSNEGGSLPNEEHDLIENVFAFGDKSVSECMTHRVDIVAIERQSSLEEVLEIVKSEKYSRIPVYEEDIDHILGTVNTRDLLLFATGNRDGRFHLDDMIRETSFAPETAKITSIFKQMQSEHNHLAVVIDEYGGTAGIVTMEDLLEEIVGNIQDEYDEEEPEIEKVTDECWLADGASSLDLIREVSGVELPVEDFDTIAGLVLDLLDRIPEPDEHPSVEYLNLTLTVEKMEDRRIEKVRICMHPHDAGERDEGAENKQHDISE